MDDRAGHDASFGGKAAWCGVRRLDWGGRCGEA